MGRIGVDLGGTKIEAVVLDEDGEVALRRRVPTPGGGYEDTLRAVAGLVLALESEWGRPCRVGVGMPGALSPASGRVKNANSQCLNGRFFDRDLAAALGRPVRVANDADCFALSEAVDGAGAGAAVVFGVILGTGCGGGVVVRGRLLAGPNAIAGEWGHNPLPWPRPEELPGPACYCGRRGCNEVFLSGPGLLADFRAAGGQATSAEEVVRAAEGGAPLAEAALQRYESRLARALAAVVNLLDPDVVVLGGGLSKLDRLYDSLPRLLPGHVFSDVVSTRILSARHGDAGGVRGAAWLWPPGGD